MDAIANVVRLPVLLFLGSLSVFLTMPQGNCIGGNSCECRPKHQPYFDGSVLAAWSRNWHAPTPWGTPLAAYYIPRTPACGCGRGEFAGCANECGAATGKYDAAMYSAGDELSRYGERIRPTGEYCGVEGGFERIGQIPNDASMAGALPPGAGAAPAR